VDIKCKCFSYQNCHVLLTLSWLRAFLVVLFVLFLEEFSLFLDVAYFLAEMKYINLLAVMLCLDHSLILVTGQLS